MPLYMDIHTVDSETLSVEDVVKAHMEDLAVQDRFGVTQIKYWVNEDAKTLFCLMKGPDKEACHQVHKESHGGTACNIIEVSDNEYNLFMGIGTDVNDLAKTEEGDLDTGYRTLLRINLICFSGDVDYNIKKVYKLIEEQNGVIILDPENVIMVSFIFSQEAILCAKSISNYLNSFKDQMVYSMAISSGRPVDESGEEMFEETKKRIVSLGSLGLTNRVYLDEETQILAEKELHTLKSLSRKFSLVTSSDIDFAISIFTILQNELTSSAFSSSDLFTALDVSKSQANRKIKSLTGMTPNELIQNSRLQLALKHISQKNNTISEVAYDTGFNSPTYFTRVFKKKFGISPSEFAKK